MIWSWLPIFSFEVMYSSTTFSTAIQVDLAMKTSPVISRDLFASMSLSGGPLVKGGFERV